MKQSQFTTEDIRWMRRALRVAEKGFTPPNPMVGCVLVRNGAVVGEGFHVAAGTPHAEVAALQEAGALAENATAYVTLEPCSHWGRTPPCADALIAAKVRRVVAAIQDVNPTVSGLGIDRLRAAGIVVDVGLLEAEAQLVNEAFFHFHRFKTPFVTLKAAVTLDGKIATSTGDSQWITSSKSREYVHLLRARSGAVMVGIGTALSDNPRLTARLSPKRFTPPARQPLRIIVDSKLRLLPTARAVQAARSEGFPLLVATTANASKEQENALAGPDVEVLRFPENAAGQVPLTILMAELARREIISVFVEGGGELNASLLDSELVHNILFFYGPMILGGRSAPGVVGGEGKQRISDAIKLRIGKVRRFGPDVAILASIVYPGLDISGC